MVYFVFKSNGTLEVIHAQPWHKFQHQDETSVCWVHQFGIAQLLKRACLSYRLYCVLCFLFLNIYSLAIGREAVKILESNTRRSDARSRRISKGYSKCISFNPINMNRDYTCKSKAKFSIKIIYIKLYTKIYFFIN